MLHLSFILSRHACVSGQRLIPFEHFVSTMFLVEVVACIYRHTTSAIIYHLSFHIRSLLCVLQVATSCRLRSTCSQSVEFQRKMKLASLALGSSSEGPLLVLSYAKSPPFRPVCELGFVSGLLPARLDKQA